MRASVAEAWPAVCSRYEGRCWWMYLDTKKLVTTGLGIFLETVEEAQSYPWFRVSDERDATQAEIATEYKRVKGLTSLAKMGGFAYKSSAKLRLPEIEIDEALMETTARFWAIFKGLNPDIDSWPADAQLAVMDMMWQNGPAYTKTWNDTRAAYRAQDWAAAAALVPGSGPRADFRKRLFRNAAKVKALNLNPDTLWNTQTPAGLEPPETSDTTPEPAPEPAGPQHSTKWNADYVSWNHGRVSPGTRFVTVLDARILDAVQAEVFDTWGIIRLSQGGLSGSVSASANTHNGLGVFDVAVDGRSQSLVWLLCKAFLRAGLVAFPRGYGDGMTPKHIHVVSRESIDNAHPEAQAQLNSAAYGYLHKILGKRGAGLAGAKWRRYIGPSIELERWHDSPYNPANVIPDDAVYYVNVAPGSSLIGNDIDRNRITTHERGTPLKIAKRVKRWDRENLATPNGIYYAAQFLSLTKPEDPEPEPGPAPEPA